MYENNLKQNKIAPGNDFSVPMDRLPNRQNFQKVRNSTIHNNSVIERPKVSKNCRVLLRNVVKCEKYTPVKFANFVYFVLPTQN